MIYYILSSGLIIGSVNLVKYITFRSVLALFTSFLISVFAMPWAIKSIRKLYPKGQPIRLDGPEKHVAEKSGTPTMGGLVIVGSIIISVALWTNLSNPFVWIVVFVTVAFGCLGLVDDYLKVSKRSHYGIRGKVKLIVQAAVSVIACFAIQKYSDASYVSHVTFPFFKNIVIDLGHFYILFVVFVIVGSSNAVNLTDGLDGLVTVPIIMVSICFAVVCYLVGNHIFANYLQVHYVSGAGELAVFCAAIVGASVGFLWYNAHPAQIFMGDTGSLALGGALGTMSVATKHEFVLGIAGGLFVIEALSVIIQVYYFKLTKGKRVFLMAPLHHHFEKKGWAETQVVTRFWIIAGIFCLLGLSTLKLR